MARRAEVILSITPEGGDKLASYIEQQVREGTQRGMSGSGSGGRGGFTNSGGGGRGDTSSRRALLQAQLDVAQAKGNIAEVGRLKTELRALTIARDADTAAVVRSQGAMATAMRVESKAIKDKERAVQEAARVQEKALRAEAQAQTQAARVQEKATKDNIRYLQDEARLLSGVEKLQTQKQATALKYAGNPEKLNRMNQLYDKKIADMQVVPAPQKTGFFADVQHGFSKAGGFGEAIGTVAKYTMVYKGLELATAAVTAPIKYTSEALVAGAKEWMNYEEAMAKASRTFAQPGMSRSTIKDVLGRDALDFISKYRVSLEEAATAQYELGSANFTAAQIMQTYQTPLKVAIALQGDITQTTRMMTQMLKIHGDEMGKNISDHDKMIRIGGILLRTWQIEQVELSDLAGAYKYVAGNAMLMKLPLEQLVPLLGLLSTYGQRGSIGGTGINQALTQMARSFTLKEGDIAYLEKKVRGSQHSIKLNLKAGEVNPLNIMEAVAGAMQKVKNGPAGTLQVSKILGDFFNMRGMRPMAILSDMKVMSQLLQNIGWAAKMSTKDMEKFTDELVSVMQNTPQAQLQLIAQTAQSIGVQFFMAAGGASTFTGALKNVHHWMLDMMPTVAALGAGLRIIVAELAGGMAEAQKGDNILSQAYNFGVGVKKGRAAGTLSVVDTDLMTRTSATYLKDISKNPKTAKATLQKNIAKIAEDEYRKNQLLLLKTNGNTDPSGTLKFINEGKTEAIRKNRAEYFGINANDSWSSNEQQMYKVKIARYDFIRKHPDAFANKIVKTNAQETMAQKAEQAELKRQQDEITSRMAGAYKNTPTGGKSGGGGSKGASKDPETERDQYISKLIQSWSDRESLGMASTNQVINDLAALRKEKGGVISIGTLANLDSAQKRRIEQVKDQGRTAEDIKKAHDLMGYEKAIKESDFALAHLENTEKMYGETVASITEKLAKLTEKRTTEKTQLAKTEVEAKTLTEKYDKLYAAWEKLKPGDNGFEKATKDLQQAKSDMDDAQKAVESLKTSLDNSAPSITEFSKQIRDIPISESMDKARRSTEMLQAQFESIGAEWQTSDEYLKSLNDSTDSQIIHAKKLKSDLDAGVISLKQYNDAMQESSDIVTKNGFAITARNRAIESTKRGWMEEIQSTRRSWNRGKDSTKYDLLAALEEKKRGMVEMYGGQAWAKPVMDEWEKTMKVDAIMRPWLDAKDKISEQWTSMFQDIFSEMSSGGNPLAAVNAVVKSIQGQWVSGFVKNTFDQPGGLFEQLATQQVGYSKPDTSKLGDVKSDTSSTASAMGSLTTSTNTLKAAFDSLTGSLSVSAGVSSQGTGKLGFLNSSDAIKPISVDDLGVGVSKGLATTLGAAGAASLASFKEQKPLTAEEIGKANVEAAKSAQSKGSGLGGFFGFSNANNFAGYMQNYSMGSMFGGISGSMAGKDPGSSSMWGGVGSVVGSILTASNPLFGVVGLGGLVGGLLGGLFGSPAQPKEDPNRSMYGMPSFEWEGYLYNLFKHDKGLDAYGLGSVYGTRLSESNGNLRAQSGVPVVTNNTGSITINVNGGDQNTVYRTVQNALKDAFGPIAALSAASVTG